MGSHSMVWSIAAFLVGAVVLVAAGAGGAWLIGQRSKSTVPTVVEGATATPLMEHPLVSRHPLCRRKPPSASVLN
jgi:hypothetical protein